MSVSLPVAPDLVDHEQPWPGLATFTEAQQAFFFGRDEETRELTRRVERKSLTILFGQSGLGKSSLLQAGVFPRLRAGNGPTAGFTTAPFPMPGGTAFPGRIGGFCPIHLRLDHAPDALSLTEQVKIFVRRETALVGTWTRPGNSAEGETLWEFFHHRDDVLRAADGRPLTPLLVFDQFEELFTLGSAAEPTRRRAESFITELADLVENRVPTSFDLRLDEGTIEAEDFDFTRTDYRVLISLREDYLPHLEGLKTSMPSLMQNRMRLTRLTGKQALEAVLRPAPGLVTEDVGRAIVAFVAGRSDLGQVEVEPSLLSLVCRELNHRRIVQKAASIDAALLAGSRETILRQFYERAFLGLPPALRNFVEDELLTDSGFRENVALERAQKRLAAAGVNASALPKLVERRLLRIEERLDVRRVELTHDVLCSVVRTSRDLRREREAGAAAEARKQEAEAALEESRQAAASDRRQAVKARLVAAWSVALALVAIFAAGWGYFNYRRAHRAETAAVAVGNDARAARSDAELARTQSEALLGFVLNDLQDQLTDLGQVPLLRTVSDRAVTYYEKLPPSLMTPSAEASYAQALANLGAVLETQGGTTDALYNFERALALYDKLANSGHLDPLQHILQATALRQMARVKLATGEFDDTVRLCERAEAILRPLLAIQAAATPAGRALGEVVHQKALSYLSAGRTTEAVEAYREALSLSDRYEAQPPSVRRPGLQRAIILPWLSEALARTGSAAESIEALNTGLTALRVFVESEPDLIPARRTLAYALGRAAIAAAARWDFAKAARVAEEGRAMYGELLKLDPGNASFRNNLGKSLTYSASIDAERRRLASAIEGWERANTLLEALPMTPFLKNNLAANERDIAMHHAALGDLASAQRHLARCRALSAEAWGDLPADSSQRLIREEQLAYSERAVAEEELRWTEVRASAARSVARLKPVIDQRPIFRQLATLAYDADARAAWALQDFPAALAAMQASLATRVPPQAGGTLDERLEELVVQVWRARILGAADQPGPAREVLQQLWPELEDVCGQAPDEPFTQALLGIATCTRAELGTELTDEERRTLFTQAASYLRPLATRAQLYRIERELWLRPVEAALGKSRP